ncbi:MAG: pilus assembly protein N-terminal domain-containing protein, partial [Bdellovibrionota bacterium]
MQLRFLLTALAGFLIWGGTAHSSPTGNHRERPGLHLRVGEQRLLKLEKIDRFSFGAPLVRSLPAPRTKDAILLKGVRAGSTDLMVWYTDGSTEHRFVHVSPPSSQGPPLPAQLAAHLETFSSIEVIQISNETLLRGELKTLEEINRLDALARTAPKTIIDETTFSANLLIEARALLEDWLHSTPWKKSLRIEAFGTELWLRGSLPSPTERLSASLQARAVFAKVREDIQAFPDSNPTIHFKVYLLEIRKRRLLQFGIQSESGAAGFQVTPWRITPQINLEFTLKALQEEGSARVLSNPELVVRAPGEAELFSGGEIPIRKTSKFGESVDWKKFGLTLTLKVIQAVETGVRLEIQT